MSDMGVAMRQGILTVVNPAIIYHLETGKEVSGETEFSLEMEKFLVDYVGGNYSPNNPNHTKCLDIIKRRGCYKTPILNEFHYLTPFGEMIAEDARIMLAKCNRYYWDNYQKDLNLNNAAKMDEVILYGKIPAQCIFILKQLYKMYKKERQVIGITTIENTFNFQTIFAKTKDADLEEQELVLMSSARNNWGVRQSVDILTKYGLIDLHKLPRSDQANGKGRPPVAFGMSSTGCVFFEDWLNNYDPMRKRMIAIEKEPKPEWFGVYEDDENDKQDNQIHQKEETDETDEEFLARRFPIQTDKNDKNDNQKDDLKERNDFLAKMSLLPDPVEKSLLSNLSEKSSQSDKPQISRSTRGSHPEISDIVDGEDLREIFGG